jgi:hypothetical protein
MATSDNRLIQASYVEIKSVLLNLTMAWLVEQKQSFVCEVTRIGTSHRQLFK